jgi:ribonuclease VapC
MARKPKAIVLDSWSILAYLEDEQPAGQKVADLIADAHENGIDLMMSVVNAGEVWYILARKTSAAEADNSVSDIRQLGIEFVEASWKFAQAAAALKAKHSMSFADCFAAALAKDTKADLVTGDPEFKQLESEIKILWM